MASCALKTLRRAMRIASRAAAEALDGECLFKNAVHVKHVMERPGG